MSKNKQKSFKPGLFEAKNYLVMNTKKFLKLGVVMLINQIYLELAREIFWRKFQVKMKIIQKLDKVKNHPTWTWPLSFI